VQWLSGKLNVPEVILTAQDEAEYMITRAVPGVLAE
jgi:kanamycin kinase